MSKKYKVGDIVNTKLIKLSRRDTVKVTGKIKSINAGFGKMAYVITEGKVEDFSTRLIK